MTSDLLSAPPVGAGGFTGSAITAWCATCQEHAVPMRDGTCGFCSSSITQTPPPSEGGTHVAACRSRPAA